jgi:hypothetical protein
VVKGAASVGGDCHVDLNDFCGKILLNVVMNDEKILF